jgi:iron complex transport system permease protein
MSKKKVQKSSGKKAFLLYAVGILLLLAVTVAAVSIGSVKIPPKEIFRILFFEAKEQIVTYDRDHFEDISLEGATGIVVVHEEMGSMEIEPGLFENIDLQDEGYTSVTVVYGEEDDSLHRDILFDIRLPRAAASLLGGAALAVAGLLLQIFFRNPIVDPYVLGISNGSTFIAALFILAGLRLGIFGTGPFGRFFAAFFGAMAVMAVVLLFALRVKQATTLLVIGIMIGYFCSAGTGFLMTFADKEAVKGFVVYSMGSFSGFVWEEVWMLAIICFLSFFGSLLIGKQLNAFLLGEDYAKSLGVNLRLFRVIIILLSGVLTAAVTAFAGPVAFIGLAVPHIVKLLFKSSDSRILLPGCILYGACITAVCDILARSVFSPRELALSTVTSVFGVPIVIHMIMKNRSNA